MYLHRYNGRKVAFCSGVIFSLMTSVRKFQKGFFLHVAFSHLLFLDKKKKINKTFIPVALCNACGEVSGMSHQHHSKCYENFI